MTYAIIGLMALGGAGEVLDNLRHASFADYGNSLMPLLLFAVAVVLAVQVYVRAANRNRRKRLPMPMEEQRLILSEKGWQAAAVTQADTADVRSWEELREQRTGAKSLILVGRGNTFAALPLRVLSGEQGGHLRRLLLRKLHRPR